MKINFTNFRICSLESLCFLENGEEDDVVIHDICWAPENESQIISVRGNKITCYDIAEAGRNAKVKY